MIRLLVSRWPRPHHHTGLRHRAPIVYGIDATRRSVRSCAMADMTMSCAVEDTTVRAEMPARMTSETAACAREDTEAYARTALPSERTDRTSKRVNDHDAVDGSRTRNADTRGKDAIRAEDDTGLYSANICDDRESPREHHAD